MNRKFISRSNYVLRKILNQENNNDILKEFIEVMLNIKIKNAKINPYLKNKKNKLPSIENFGIADLRIKTQDDNELNIGIQMIDGKHVLNKMLLYYVQIHFYQLEHQEKRKLAKTITINILDFQFINKNSYHHKMTLKSNSLVDIHRGDIEMHIIELPKFKKKLNLKMTLKEAWISYLKGDYEEDAIKASKKIKKLDNLVNKYWDNEIIE